MSVFGEAVLSLLAQYRKLLRTTIPEKALRDKKLIELDLDYQYSKDTDTQLYTKLQNVVKDLKAYCENIKQESSYYRYSGTIKFYNHLEAWIKQYILKNDEVIHCTQLASRHMLEVIQLASSPAEKLCSSDVIKRLAAANQKIALYGSDEQHQHHIDNLKKYREFNTAFFDGMIHNFNKSLNETKSLNYVEPTEEDKLVQLEEAG